MQVIDKFPPDFDTGPFHDLVEKWFAAGSAANLPDKAHFEQERLLFRGYHMTVGIDPMTSRFQYLSVGPALEKLYGKKMSGKYLDELYNMWFRKVALNIYRTAFEHRLPVYERRTISTIIKKIGYQKIILPVGEGETISEFAAWLLPTDLQIRTKEDWEKLVKETPWL